jgi:hypothetical protein
MLPADGHTVAAVTAEGVVAGEGAWARRVPLQCFGQG